MLLTKPTARQRLGRQAERIALRTLKTHGLRLVAQNYHCHYGELDLVFEATSELLLIVVEVRYRRNSDFGGAEDSVTAAKQAKITKATEVFLSQHACFQHYAIRFDIVAFEGDLKTCQPRWIKDAF